MINNFFQEKVDGGEGGALVLVGSASDELHINDIVNNLVKYEIPYDLRISSAHRTTAKLLEIISEYEALSGFFVYLAIAGKTDALSGILSYHATRPVISCPPDAHNESCLNNPSGSSNTYIAHPRNAARAVAQILTSVNPKYRELLLKEMSSQQQEINTTDCNLQEYYTKGRTKC